MFYINFKDFNFNVDEWTIIPPEIITLLSLWILRAETWALIDYKVKTLQIYGRDKDRQ